MNLAERVEASYDRTVASARKRFGWFDHGWLAKERFEEVFGGRLAAAISYYAFFAAFALAVVGYSILGRALGADNLSSTAQTGLVGTINNYLSSTLPWVVQTAQQVGRGEVTVVGLVALLLSGVGWVEALRSAQRAVWRLDQDPGNWIIRRVVDLVMLIGLGVLLILSLAISLAFDTVLDLITPDTTFGNLVNRGFGPVLEFVVNLVLAGAILVALPRLRLSWRRLVPAVIFVGVGIQVLNTIGKWFIARSEHRPAYQLVAGAVGLLIYLYLLNQLILFGAALAATHTRGRMVDLAAGPVSPASPVAGSTVDSPGNDAVDVGEARTRRPGKPR
jgi:membrane protein